MEQLRHSYHKMLHDDYIVRQKWNIQGNPSHFFIEDGALFDKQKDVEVVYTLVLNQKVVLGFRIVEKCLDLRNHSHKIPEKILDNAIESNRFILDEDFRGLGLAVIAGKIMVDYAREHNFRYLILISKVSSWQRYMRVLPGVKIIKNACTYPEDCIDAYIFNTKSILFRLAFSDFIYKLIFGFRLASAVLKNIKRVY